MASPPASTIILLVEVNAEQDRGGRMEISIM
jgi:hypothetical protein